ncbi:hypothetical protein Tter_0029 [Thermobaculum terrenum ATCC BAA-798]|uniref:Uncharacterized protein n=1 Tax=Thermobaculum terrenum (strain ATCC BAA-798 / CCMEE 7001 / YNP1) TaxID=525904 RepID=D1CDE6_THET1|nr:hypothetical protein [Thermobaculum terrenum]ACZ40952.1 hypothetical protein Tter_0029 [Thermobaculum terrenum ATCC BAA-798]
MRGSIVLFVVGLMLLAAVAAWFVFGYFLSQPTVSNTPPVVSPAPGKVIPIPTGTVVDPGVIYNSPVR